MSRKHSELEREFIAELATRTGRSLAQWMAAIDAAAIADRNAIIDWLRPQGLTFAHASWLERIHQNGGKPIYVGLIELAPGSGWSPPIVPASASMTTSTKRDMPSRPTLPLAALPPAPLAPAASPPRTPPQAGSTQPPRPPNSSAILPPETMANLLARGKGLRPLAEFVLREISAALPSVVIRPVTDFVAIANPAEIAVLAIAPRELRLGFALGNLTFDHPPLTAALLPARIAGAGANITHMTILSDARQVDSALMDLVKLADREANPI